VPGTHAVKFDSPPLTERISSRACQFDSGCGWPAFDKCYAGSITAKPEDDGTDRVEIVCSKCNGHLGHVFTGESFTETGERHCANARSLQFVKAKIDQPEVKLM
jgi:peptide-methionine (R)-S-oxide reductase